MNRGKKVPCGAFFPLVWRYPKFAGKVSLLDFNLAKAQETVGKVKLLDFKHAENAEAQRSQRGRGGVGGGVMRNNADTPLFLSLRPPRPRVSARN